MKKIVRFVSLCCLTAMFGLTACSQEDSLGESRLVTTPEQKSDLDNWIDDNYTYPYNMAVFYKWDPYKVDKTRYLTPIEVNRVQPALEVIKTIWLDSYKEIAGEMFVKQTAPRELVMVGSVNANTTNTVTLGLAEQGVRISLFAMNYLDTKNKEEVEEFIHTIQHEYVHILNQSKPFNEQEYGSISAGDYMGDWQNGDDDEAWELGFISAYSRSNVTEDFAEQASWMLKDINAYNAIVNAAPAEGRAKIRKKEAFVVAYYLSAFGIDFYELCNLTTANTEKAVNKK
ncbi:substrate import-associated zinc metallohydrolase lipoprotein [Myroides phaeus]|uniref:Substrate import-associated zinc metallohydrolase lipoprotein n=1 Tax=Myroides phaeus TaxID=702745 RepID=A0A1G8FX94_9FLAO|nr:substrate import-associated zinc metallohydrolase lipoprotein [Myroides phaeus]MEC4115395.1 substrate import-associated zinc metallohydrolase lipoprotein [Myroides phaeus]SDH86778.1 substrate import-associated zinc metallohydrolase lipoprotein [Myroides phaeus]